MSTNNNAVILARVSSKTQEDEGYSLDSQLKLLRKYCNDLKFNVIKEFRISETASKEERRKTFKDLLIFIAKQRVTHLAVEKTDRLTRNFRDAVAIDDWLAKNEHHRLHAVKENMLLHKNAKSDVKFMWNIHLAVAKKYTDNLREEAMKGWDEKLAQGWMPCPPPPGYKTATEDGKKIHVPDEQTMFIIARIFKLYLEPSQCVRTIVDELALCGVTTKKGRPLSKSSVAKMLRNPFYMGVIRFNGKEYPGAHEPIVSKELFDDVQRKLTGKRGARARKHDPLFRGMLRCTHCKGMVTWYPQKGRFYGSCQRRLDICKQRPLLREDRVETLVVEKLKAIDDPGHKILSKLEATMEGKRHPYVGQHREKIIESLQRRLARTKHMEEALYEDKLAGILSEKRYLAKCQKLQEDKEILQERIKRLSGRQEPSKVKIHRNKKHPIASLYNSSSKEEKRIIVSCLYKIIVHSDAAFFSIRPSKPPLQA